MGRYVILETTGVLHAEYFYDSLFTVVWVFALFAAVNKLDLKQKVKNLIAKIAPLTMGIYIVHPLLIRVYTHFFAVDSIPLALIYFAVIFVSSAIVAAIMNNIPFVKKLIKL